MLEVADPEQHFLYAEENCYTQTIIYCMLIEGASGCARMGCGFGYNCLESTFLDRFLVFVGSANRNKQTTILINLLEANNSSY